MAVPHGGLVVRMAEDPADGVEVDPRVNHERGSGVPQVVDAEVRQP